MRRGLAWMLALTLCVGGVAACGSDDDSSGADDTTTPSSAPTTVAEDLTAAVDEFCAKIDEIRALASGLEPGDDGQPSAADQERLTTLGGEAAQMMMTLQGSVARMLPGDAGRFQECASLFGGAGGG